MGKDESWNGLGRRVRAIHVVVVISPMVVVGVGVAVLGGLMAAGGLIHERQAASMEAELRGRTWPEGVTVTASGHAVNGPVSSNSCLLEGAVVLDGVREPLPDSLYAVRGPVDDVDMVRTHALARLAEEHPPRGGRWYVSVTEFDASSFAFRWNRTCH